MAKRKRRKSAGPQPTRNPRRAGLEASGGAGAARAARPKAGEPVPPSIRGVAIRAGIVAALFFPYLVYVVGESPGAAAIVTAIAFGLMIPLGMALDRFRYRRQRRRWEERRAARSPASR